jgi:hypothetical protein
MIEVYSLRTQNSSHFEFILSQTFYTLIANRFLCVKFGNV